MKCWTQEWAETIKEKSHTDRDYLRKTKGWSIKFYWIMTDFPDGTDKCLECHTQDGKVTFIKLEEKSTPSGFAESPWDASEYFVRAIAPYEVWRKVNTGEWSTMKAISSGEMTLEGKVQELIDRISQFAAFSSGLVPSIPIEYY